ncbi:hypothetical protein CTAYLR_007358 [Chrysophaeum taylorii]|uniref:RRM domain-containing protein n=1 Tax=Chrysophaeum taylorii TaxID=2483200 RepID=A0AAD7U4Y7_9STRA|nr:hypothetical protein CTAYLR_007358 [Chrysophaeum taylorii]
MTTTDSAEKKKKKKKEKKKTGEEEEEEVVVEEPKKKKEKKKKAKEDDEEVEEAEVAVEEQKKKNKEKKKKKKSEEAAAAAEEEPAKKKKKKKDESEVAEDNVPPSEDKKKKKKKKSEEPTTKKREAEPVVEKEPEAKKPKTNGDEIRRVFVNNLSWQIDEDTLKNHVADCGEVLSIEFIEDRNTGKFKGMATIEFATAEAATAAVGKKHETEVAGRVMYCRLEKPKPTSATKGSRPLKPKPEGGKKVYCGNLSYDVDDYTIKEFFKDCGTVEKIRWVTDRESGDFKGCGFLEFTATDEADKAIAKQGEYLLGRPVRLDWAEDRPPRS